MKKLELMDVDGAAFGQALDIWCGKKNSAEINLGDVRELARVADRFQMTEVILALEKTVIGHLNLSMCGEVLSWNGEPGLKQSEAMARSIAVNQFVELVKTEDFMQMGEEVLGKLLEDDHLVDRKSVV